MFDRRGFIGVRTLLALLITIAILPLAVYTMVFAANIKFDFDKVNDELALYQLRRIMLISYDVENYGNSLEFLYHNDQYSLALINRRLVLQPGYQMFLDDIDYLDFVEEGNAILIRYGKNNQEFKAPIVKRNGIHLADFSDNNDDDSDDIDSD